MRAITWLIVIGAVAGAVATEFFAFYTVEPQDAVLGFILGVWVAVPYLTAIWFGISFRKQRLPQTVLLITFIVSAGSGLYPFIQFAVFHADAKQQLESEVQPGEDPSAGASSMRKSGAELNAGFVWGIALVLAALVPPAQFVGITVPTLIAWGVGAARKKPEEELAGVS